MSTPSITMPMTWASALYLRWIAKSRRPVSARREPESGWLVSVRPVLSRFRYCWRSESEIGTPSM